MYFTPNPNHQYVLRLNRGEQVVATLKKFCQKQMIGGAFFYGLGAVDQAELAFYDLDKQEYHKKTYQQPLEVTNLTGNISMIDGQVTVHAHVTLGDSDYQTMGGHLMEMRVSAAMEIFLQAVNPLTKIQDPQTGLNLLQLEQSE